jgi:hypothetical protein
MKCWKCEVTLYFQVRVLLFQYELVKHRAEHRTGSSYATGNDIPTLSLKAFLLDATMHLKPFTPNAFQTQQEKRPFKSQTT